MTRILTTTAMALFAGLAMAGDESSFDAAVRGAGASADELARASDAALWNRNRSAAAVSFHRRKRSLVLVLLRQRGDKFRVVDVSRVEDGNFGKLGTDRSRYERFQTQPVEWLPRKDGSFQVVIRTRAWQSGQRYTTSEPLIIRPDGSPLWR